jgi:hypothetical protein
MSVSGGTYGLCAPAGVSRYSEKTKLLIVSAGTTATLFGCRPFHPLRVPAVQPARLQRMRHSLAFLSGVPTVLWSGSKLRRVCWNTPRWRNDVCTSGHAPACSSLVRIAVRAHLRQGMDEYTHMFLVQGVDGPGLLGLSRDLLSEWKVKQADQTTILRGLQVSPHATRLSPISKIPFPILFSLLTEFSLRSTSGA